MSAVERANCIPEIVSHIVRSIDDCARLARAARVNRTWYKEAIPVLWEGLVPCTWRPVSDWSTPVISYLQTLAQDPERFKYYMGFVRFLRILQNPAYGRYDKTSPIWEVEGTIWETVKPLSIVANMTMEYSKETEWILQLVHPGLKYLEVHGGKWSDYSVTELKRRAPRLQAIRINNNSTNMGPSLLRTLLSDSTGLRSLELCDFHNSVTASILEDVMRMPTLEHLSLERVPVPTHWMLQQVDPAVRFQRLRSLRLLYVATETVSELLRSLERLESIHIVHYGRSILGHISLLLLEPLSACSKLAEVEIHMYGFGEGDEPGDDGFMEDGLVSLARCCPILRKLLIRTKFQRTAPLRTDALDEIVTGFPFLEALALPCHRSTLLTSSNLATLAESCPRIRSLELGDVRMNLLIALDQNPQMVFPVLEQIHTGNIVDKSRTSSEYTARRLYSLFRNHLPRLCLIHQTWNRSDVNEIGKLLNEHIASKHGGKRPGKEEGTLQHDMLWDILHRN